jgi:hypothetical protein
MATDHFGPGVAERYDAGSAEMFAPAVVDPAVQLLAELAGTGAALELGVGTGRIALPLSRRGVRVHGIDLSEAMLAQLQRLPPGETVRPFAVSADRLGFDEYDVPAQGLVSHHYRVEDGALRVQAVPFRYVWPAELDLMARLAGLRLVHRWGDWDRSPFTAASGKHVSVWRKG